jgi:uncharacterized protein (DUF1800 family)
MRLLVSLTVCVALVGFESLPNASGSASTRGDLRWLARVTFGIDSATVTRFRQLGREKFLDEQLHPLADDPPALASSLAAMPMVQESAQARIQANRAEQQRINALTNEDDKQKARMALNQAGNEVLYETTKRHLMRAVRSPSQLREQMTWFWMNHFSVLSGKANIRWTLAEYEAQVRAHAFGKFSDLVLATATSPAMLEYLDNAQSAVGKINENYARELMELHTLGVSGGPSGSTYTQQDVQELARVLTGAGVNFTDATPRLPPNLESLYVRRGLFEFNPARHDLGPKVVLGQQISGKGLSEIDNAIALLCRQPAAARFISAKLATAGAARRAHDPHVPGDRRIDRRRAARDVSGSRLDGRSRAGDASPRKAQGPDAIRGVVGAARLRWQTRRQLPPHDRMAATAWRAALRPGDA